MSTAAGAPVMLVVGAGDYIGAAIARKFAREGFVTCMGRRRGEKLDPLVAGIRAEGGVAHGFTMDARSEDNTAEIFAHIEQTIGEIDVLIFNVGGNVHFPILETTERVFSKVWEMCCFAAFFSGREAARYMVPRGRGRIFFTGASASMRGNPGFAAFSAGKGGMRMLAQSMARELGPQGIHVAHLVIDAGVDTEFVREIHRARGQNPDELQPDTLMNPESVANAYWYLYNQKRDAWTFELDVRPFAEKW